MNRDTEQWHGFQGFVARILEQQDSPATANRFSKKKVVVEGSLNVRTIDVDQWQALDEVSKIQLLSNLLQSAEPEAQKKVRV